LAGIKIVTDSASSLPEFLVKKLNIEVVKIPVTCNGKEVPTETYDEFYRFLEEGEMPKTSAPSPGDFLETYKEVLKSNDTIISIHISGKVSATYQSACLAREMLPKKDIYVVDSNNVSMATGFLVITAARKVIEGWSVEEILPFLEKVKERVGGMVVLPTLKYLAKSGRVSQVKALLGNILSIKPILVITKGEVKVIDKTRSVGSSLNRMLDLVQKKFGSTRLQVAVIHSNAANKASEYLEKVKGKLDCTQAFISEMGPGLAVHGGPNMIGLVWMEEN